MGVVLLCTVILIGTIIGALSGVDLRKKLHVLEEGMRQLGSGYRISSPHTFALQEMDAIWSRMSQLDFHIQEQTKIAQKSADDKASSQEKMLQEIISQERNRLARELHDSVSQQLFAASMLMSAVTEGKGEVSEAKRKQLNMIEQMIQQAQLEMRALLLHLRPVALKDKTLQEGMEELLLELSQKVPLEIRWKIEAMKLSKGIEDHLFRILQESVSNTLRHAKATSLEVLLIERDGLHIMRVTDDGVGFEVDKNKAGSYGLQTMHERALEVGGSLKIVSLPTRGTRLEVRVPIVEKGRE